MKNIIEHVAAQTELDITTVKLIINTTFDCIKAELKCNKKVIIPTFGVFETKDRAQRTGFNPKSKESLLIPAKRYPVFRAAKALKDEVSE